MNVITGYPRGANSKRYGRGMPHGPDSPDDAHRPDDPDAAVVSSAVTALSDLGVPHRTVRYQGVRSVAEAAQRLGIAPGHVTKTLVIRRADDDFVFVLVPGDRVISWPKLRGVLGVHRLSMPDAGTAREVTGYERGTITPFGSLRAWPVVADERIAGHTVSLGSGVHGATIVLNADDAIRALDAALADVTDPA